MIFKALFEVKDSAVTLSPALAKHMIKHCKHGRRSLKVMTAYVLSHKEVCLHINPPYEQIEKEYQDTLNEIQYIPDTHEIGFAMINPEVTGLLQGFNIPIEEDTKCYLYIKSFTLTDSHGYKHLFYRIKAPQGKLKSVWYEIMAHLGAWYMKLTN